MKHTIYKPSIYNGPTLYNGDGSVYNGRGVYKDGKKSNIIYELSIEDFNTSTLKDRDFQWDFWDGGSICPITKTSDYIQVNFKNAFCQFRFNNTNYPNLDMTRKIVFEAEFELARVSTTNAGYWNCEVNGNNSGYFSNLGITANHVSSYTSYNCSLFYNSGTTRRFQSAPNTTKTKYKLIHTNWEKKDELYINDTHMVDIIHTNNTMATFILANQYDRIATNCNSKLYKLKIYYD